MGWSVGDTHPQFTGIGPGSIGRERGSVYLRYSGICELECLLLSLLLVWRDGDRLHAQECILSSMYKYIDARIKHAIRLSIHTSSGLAHVCRHQATSFNCRHVQLMPHDPPQQEQQSSPTTHLALECSHFFQASTNSISSSNYS